MVERKLEDIPISTIPIRMTIDSKSLFDCLTKSSYYHGKVMFIDVQTFKNTYGPNEPNTGAIIWIA